MDFYRFSSLKTPGSQLDSLAERWRQRTSQRYISSVAKNFAKIDYQHLPKLHFQTINLFYQKMENQPKLVPLDELRFHKFEFEIQHERQKIGLQYLNNLTVPVIFASLFYSMTFAASLILILSPFTRSAISGKNVLPSSCSRNK